ncbi:ShlB/FhaC/HecB family hemolysin secretion/activation protein [Devosia sp. MC1541]|uniref:ShlB/FhaC/HecB family hemolysin secretion/activation protein n=1 Tax=Devosia sp. MC1541 TaxID=2725264 RepID=UPI00145D6725|nr:ShlB/FhaC/HecB family hemolysin secretion/activation protein [Devosia sp. MC1541]
MRLEAERSGTASTLSNTLPEAPTDLANLASAECLPIREVLFDGASLFAQEYLSSLHAGLTCFSLEQMFELVRQTTNLYVDAGFVTSRAYLPEQDLSSGHLRISVMEGQLADVELVENGQSRAIGHVVLPVQSDRVVQLRAFEQGIDQINSLGSMDAKVSFRPGEDVGTSVGIVEISSGLPISIKQSLDNSGADSTGKLQSATNLVLEDTFGAFETIRASYKRNLDTADNSKTSQNVTASLTLPVGDWTFDVSSNFYSYRSPITGQLQTFESAGESWNHTFDIRRLLTRSQSSKTHLTLGLSSKANRNFLAGSLIDISSRNLTIGRLGLEHEEKLSGIGVVKASAGVSRGLPFLGVDVDADPFSIFTKVDGQVDLTLQNQNGMTWSTTARAQWSPDPLYSSEHMSVGGSSSVRGFESAVLGSENAVIVRNEASYRTDFDNDAFRAMFGQAAVFGALDLGWSFPGASDAGTLGNAAGIAGGIRLQNGMVFGEVSLEKSLLSSQILPGQPVYRFSFGIAPIHF